MIRCIVIFLLTACLGFTNITFSQSFKPIEEGHVPDVLWFSDSKSLIYRVDTTLLEKELFINERLLLPFPDGRSLDLNLKPNQVLPEKLSKKYHFGSWDAINSIHGISGKIDYTNHGIRGMFYEGKEIIYLEPIVLGQKTYVQIFRENRSSSPHSFNCFSHDPSFKDVIESQTDGVVGINKRTLDIAIAATGEYTAYYGGTVTDGLSGIITTLNRVNAVFEKDMALSFRLVPNNDLIVFTNASTDPYSNGDLSRMLNENQSTLNTQIGSSAYDIGHVFGTLGGGLARLNSVCRISDKAKGTTGLLNPQGDVFNIDYVCHEIGHQLGASHTFNNCDGSWGGNSSFEPGSGTTIMSYAGICGPTNVQGVSDQHFHIGSLLQMNNTPNSCASIDNADNEMPEVFFVSPTNMIAPILTPFVLEGFATDANNEDIEYSWDQMDVSGINPYGSPNPDGPLFRYLEPSEELNKRYFPSLNNLINGNHPAEVLPDQSRTVNFNLTARDQHNQAGATAYKLYSLEFTESAGPFKVLYPNDSGIQHEEGDFITVQWDVSNTDQAPVNCQLVSILLSIDGGFTYDIVLNEVTPNDGFEEVALPFLSSPNCRIMVKAADHLFFNISENEFEIGENPVPEINLVFEDSLFQICNSNSIDIDFRVEGLNNYTYLTDLRIVNPPSFLQFFFDPSTSFRTDRNVRLQIFDLNLLSSGNYEFEIIAESINQQYSASQTIKLNIQKDRPDPPVFIDPQDLSFSEENIVQYSWFPSSQVDQYHVQIAKDKDFEDLILDTFFDQPTTAFDFQAPAFSVLYSRISGTNSCGEGDFSESIKYHISGQRCLAYRTEENFDIPIGSPTFNLFEVEVNEDFLVEQIRLDHIEGTHDNTAVLEFNLLYPDQTKKSLITLPCLDETEYLFGISDESNFGFSCPFNRDISYLGEEPLNDVLPISSQGVWALEIINNDATMIGTFKEWTLELCGTAESDSASIKKMRDNLVQVPLNSSAIINDNHCFYESAGFPSEDIVLKLKSLPAHGRLLLEGVELEINDWIVQEDLLDRVLSYEHLDSAFRRDSFFFDVLVHGVGKLENQRLDIFIADGNMSASANITRFINCPEINDGEVRIQAFGGTPPYEYGIQGLVYQNDPVFSGLSPDYYIFTVRDQMGSEIALPGIELLGKSPFTFNYTQNGRDLSFHITGGTPPYEYSLDGGLLTSDSTFVNVSSGTHRLRVFDQLTCEKEFFFNFEFQSITILLETLDPLSCHDSNDGIIEVGAIGGLKPYRFSINNGPFTFDSLFTQLSAGLYTIRVIDALNEFDELINLEIFSPDPITASTTVLDQDIYINASGGTGQYVYNIDGGQFTTNSVFENVPYGLHMIGIRDQQMCYTEIEVNVLENPINVQYEWLNLLDCFNDSTAQIEVIASGGTPPYEYGLKPDVFQNDPIFSNLPAGIYNLYVKDDQGQVQILTGITLENPEEIKITTNYINDTLSLFIEGGYPPYFVSIDQSIYTNDSIFTGLTQGPHTISVLDANDCEVSQAFTINTSPLQISINILEMPNCADSEDGVLIVSGSGGVPPYQYSLNNVDYQMDNVFTGLRSRSYVAYVKDSEGTIGLSNPVMMEAPLPLVASIYTSNDTARVEAFGGTAPILVAMDGGPLDSIFVFTDLEPGNHEILLQDANGCEKQITFSIKTTSIIDIETSGIHLYPNPAINEVILTCNTCPETKTSEVRIFNTLGVELIRRDWSKETETLNISSLVPGSYWLELNMEDLIVRKKLVVQ